MRLISLIIIVAWLGACSEDESVNSSGTTRISSPFLSTTNIGLTTTPKRLSTTESVAVLAAYEHVYLNAPVVTDEEAGCRKALYGKLTIQSSAATFSDPASISHGIDIDYKSCRAKGIAEGTKVKSSRLQMFRRFGCEYKDPEDADALDTASLDAQSGKPGSSFETIWKEQTCTRRTHLMTGKIVSSISGSSGSEENNDLSTFSYTETIYLYTGTDDLLACEETLADEVWAKDDECKYIYRVVRSNKVTDGTTVAADEDYIRVIPTTLTYPVGDLASVWLASGSLGVKVNDWSGTLTYSAIDAAPTYSLSNGIQTITGDLPPRSDETEEDEETEEAEAE